MPKPIFIPLGDNKNDYITVDGQIDWATIPARHIGRQNCDMPIRVRVGDQSFGIKHIYAGHSKWLSQMKRTPEELIWEKLSLSGGNFYRGKKNRITMYVRLSPTCFLVLESQMDQGVKFYSVVSLYKKSPHKDDEPIATYESAFANPLAKKALRRC
ncbi:hypothetical protein D5073_21055 [Pectobacterium versatile]|nr:hypothetical protein F018LOC_04410 [Pectobacterium versatile]RJL48119.1 hypothetical protein D5073_21055 [Pectobacterium versatile]RJL53047.1 hypothetical protein D5076_20115 [Pectobacterium versatile]